MNTSSPSRDDGENNDSPANNPQIEASLQSSPIAGDGVNEQARAPGPILVSRVKNAWATATTDREATSIIEQIRTNTQLEEQVEPIRRKFQSVMAKIGGDRKAGKDAVDEPKKNLPGVMWSGTFSQRKGEALLQHSGLLCADLDGLGDQIAEIREKLKKSIFLWALFLSPTGDGLKAVFRVPADAEKHKASVRAVEDHVRLLTGVQIDKSCKDVGRLCFLSHDHDVYLNEGAAELPPPQEPTTPPRAANAGVCGSLIEGRRQIAEELLGDIDWITETEGYCECPGQDLHTSGDGARDCKAYLADAPNIFCFHNSCRDIIEETNRDLCSRIGRAELASANGIRPVQWFNERFPSLSAKFGDAVLIGQRKGGSLYVQDIGEDFMAATLGEESRPDTPTIFVPIEQKFYTYSPTDGIYIHRREPVLLTELSRLLLDCARDCEEGLIDTRPLQFRLRDSKKLIGVLKKAQALLAVPDDFFSTGLTEFIPCANGMLRLSDRELLPFSPTYHRRNKLAVAFDPNAKCPLFLDTLMSPALDPDELDLLQRWCGLALIGENLAQRFPILTGTAGGGKGTFIRVLVGIIGQANVASLRTQLLGERFELGRFLGKTLLYGADVPEKFLNHRGASVLKSLTGGDPITFEFKRSNESPLVICKFNAIVTCNSRLTVHLEGDTDAWRRRLVIFHYAKPKTTKIVADLSEQILATERSGVFNWMLNGLDKVRADGWQLNLTPAQQKLVDDLLLESESHIIFARNALFLSLGQELTVDDCYAAYIRFCSDRGWISLPKNKFSTLIGDAVARMHGLTIRHDLKNGRFVAEQRGWKGIVVGSAFAGDLE